MIGVIGPAGSLQAILEVLSGSARPCVRKLALGQAVPDGQAVEVSVLQDAQAGMTLLGVVSDAFHTPAATGVGDAGQETSSEAAAQQDARAVAYAAAAAQQQAALLLFACCRALVLVTRGPTVDPSWLHRLRALQQAKALLQRAGDAGQDAQAQAPPVLHVVLQAQGGTAAAGALAAQARALLQACLLPTDPAVLAAARAGQGGDAGRSGAPPGGAEGVQLFSLGEVVAAAPIGLAAGERRQLILAAAVAGHARSGAGAGPPLPPQYAHQQAALGRLREALHAQAKTAAGQDDAEALQLAWRRLQQQLQPSAAAAYGAAAAAAAAEACDQLLVCADPVYRLSAAACARAARAAAQAYGAGLPARYAQPTQDAAVARALQAYSAHAVGPAQAEYRRRLVNSCCAEWTAGRQLCGALSLTGRACVLDPHRAIEGDGGSGTTQPHDSQTTLQLASHDGSVLLSTADWYDVAAANSPDQAAPSKAACNVHPAVLRPLCSGRQAAPADAPAEPAGADAAATVDGLLALAPPAADAGGLGVGRNGGGAAGGGSAAAATPLGPWLSAWRFPGSGKGGHAYETLQQPGFVGGGSGQLQRVPLLALPQEQAGEGGGGGGADGPDAATAAAAAAATAAMAPAQQSRQPHGKRGGRTAAAVVAGRAAEAPPALLESDFPTLASTLAPARGAAGASGPKPATTPRGGAASGAEAQEEAARQVQEAWQLLLGSGAAPERAREVAPGLAIGVEYSNLQGQRLLATLELLRQLAAGDGTGTGGSQPGTGPAGRAGGQQQAPQAHPRGRRTPQPAAEAQQALDGARQLLTSDLPLYLPPEAAGKVLSLGGGASSDVRLVAPRGSGDAASAARPQQASGTASREQGAEGARPLGLFQLQRLWVHAPSGRAVFGCQPVVRFVPADSAAGGGWEVAAAEPIVLEQGSLTAVCLPHAYVLPGPGDDAGASGAQAADAGRRASDGTLGTSAPHDAALQPLVQTAWDAPYKACLVAGSLLQLQRAGQPMGPRKPQGAAGKGPGRGRGSSAAG